MNRALRVGLHLSAFLLGTFAVVIGLGVAVALGLVAVGGDPSRPEELLESGVLGLLSIVQIVLVAAVAVTLAAAFPAVAPPGPGPERGSDALGDRLRAAFPVAPSPLHVGAAVVGGLLVWTFPTWLAEQLSTLVDLGSISSLELVADGLRDPDPVGRATLVVAVTVTAPLFEELVFRGYLWRVIAWGYGDLAALGGTTLLFAAYHLDPIQAVCLLPTALFLGWLRLRSGSLAPGVVAHFVNNGIAVLAAATWPEDARVPLWLGLFGAGGVLALCALTDRFAPRAAG